MFRMAAMDESARTLSTVETISNAICSCWIWFCIARYWVVSVPSVGMAAPSNREDMPPPSPPVRPGSTIFAAPLPMAPMTRLKPPDLGGCACFRMSSTLVSVFWLEFGGLTAIFDLLLPYRRTTTHVAWADAGSLVAQFDKPAIEFQHTAVGRHDRASTLLLARRAGLSQADDFVPSALDGCDHR